MRTHIPDYTVDPTLWWFICISSPQLRDNQIAGDTLFLSASLRVFLARSAFKPVG